MTHAASTAEKCKQRLTTSKRLDIKQASQVPAPLLSQVKQQALEPVVNNTTHPHRHQKMQSHDEA
jgi:hypothetical protein